MKKTLLAAILLAAVSTAMAQPPSGERRRGMPEEFAKRQASLKDSLKLTSEQSAKYDEISAKYRKQMEEVIAGGSKDREQRRTAIGNINAARDAELQQALKPEQYELYKKLTARPEGGPRGGGRR